MTIRDFLNEVNQVLLNVPERQLVAEILCCHQLGVTREKLFMMSAETIDTADAEALKKLLQRHLDGEPVAYITGNKEFFGLDFLVNPDVLIPRPETEMLVEEVLDYVQKNCSVKNILDIGTGSGAIALSIAKNTANIKVVGVDISDAALAIARQNMSSLGLNQRATFLHSDLLANVPGKFEVIVANLPYIGIEKFNLVSQEALKYEPHIALFGGSDGLRLYEQLFQQIAALAYQPSLLLGEFGFAQGDEMSRLLDKYFPGMWIIKKDLALIDRIFVVRWGA